MVKKIAYIIIRKKQFKSYFITFEGGARLELMKRVGIEDALQTETIGYAHIAFSVGSKEKVNELTNTLREAGYAVLNGPRTTGGWLLRKCSK